MPVPRSYTPRLYRTHAGKSDWQADQVTVKETDIWIHAPRNVTPMARELIIQCRNQLETFIASHPSFLNALTPWDNGTMHPMIVQKMINSAKTAGVGPMAAVAGAVAEWVGQGILSHPEGCDEIIIENGGDLFLKIKDTVTIGIHAGDSAFGDHLGLVFPPNPNPFSVCTSSGTIGHSLSMGRADAVSVIAESASLADACATALGNRISSAKDIASVIEAGKKIKGVQGVVIIVADKIGMWGDFELRSLR